MIQASILTELENLQFVPGGDLRGAVRWQSPSKLAIVELRLFYYTTGKGTRDTVVVDTLSWSDPPSDAEQQFSFPLPPGPYSFSGDLVALTWALELVFDPERHTERLEITVSPTGHEIDLNRYPVPPELNDENEAKAALRARLQR